jgi:hypothetical protein
MVERELEQRNAPAARAFAAEMGDPEPALVARIEALEAEQRAAREREQASVDAAKAMDASVLRGPRVLMLTIFLAGATIANVLAVVQELRTGIATPMSEVLITDVVQLAMVFIGLITAGKRLLAHSYNRRVVGVLVLATLTVTALDLFAWARQIGSRTANLLDCVAMINCFAVAALGIEPGWWRIVLVWIAAAGVAFVAPVLANGAASAATVATVLIGIQVARHSAARRRGLG